MLKNIINNFFSFHFFLKTFNHLNKIKYFVQVGAHDGIMHDPLHQFLSKNEWSGVLVEPQKDMLKQFQERYKHRSNLLFYSLAAHPKKSTVELITVKKPTNYSQTGWATLITDRLSNNKNENELEIINVEAMHLMKIIEDSGFEIIDLLQIDTEGFDYEILQMFNFELYKPLLVHYEYVHLSKIDYENSIELLRKNGYKTIKKNSDIIALKKNRINVRFILLYIFFRIKASIYSRIRFFSN